MLSVGFWARGDVLELRGSQRRTVLGEEAVDPIQTWKKGSNISTGGRGAGKSFSIS